MKHLIFYLYIFFTVFLSKAETFSTQGFRFNTLVYGVELISNVDENGVKVVPDYTGDVVIPEQVSYEGRDFFVTQIASDAFEYSHDVTSVTMPQFLKIIEERAFRDCNSNCPMLKTITCLPKFPPETLGNITDEINYLYTTLRIPQSAKGAYFLQKYDWSKFVNYVVFDENSGIEPIIQSNKTILGRYNLDGVPVNESYKGIMLIRLSDGTVMKTISE